MQLGILKLPPSDGIVPGAGNNFVIQTYSSNLPLGVTQKISFENMIFPIDNVTFSPVISSHSTEIDYLSTQLFSLSAIADQQAKSLAKDITDYVTKSFFDLTLSLYPIDSIRYTTSLTNPATIIPNTVWVLVGQSNLIAGVGTTASPGDKNLTTVTFFTGNSATNETPGNFNLGEYGHPVTVPELPAHKHRVTPLGQEDGVAKPGLIIQSSGGGFTRNVQPLVSTFTGGNLPHNNVPPVYGVYIWRRIG
jgi:hypothetical protein